MRIQIEFYTDNSVFEDNLEKELTFVLTQVTKKVRDQMSTLLQYTHLTSTVECGIASMSINLLDSNGNKIGTVKTRLE